MRDNAKKSLNHKFESEISESTSKNKIHIASQIHITHANIACNITKNISTYITNIEYTMFSANDLITLYIFYNLLSSLH